MNDEDLATIAMFELSQSQEEMKDLQPNTNKVETIVQKELP
jgi:hypothetical protein